MFAASCLAGCLAVLVIGMMLMAGTVLPTMLRARRQANAENCQGNLKRLVTALHLYASDHDGRYPPAATWQSSVAALASGEDPTGCPAAPDLAPGYAYHSALDARRGDRIPDPASQPVFFDSTLGRENGSDAMESFSARHPAAGGRKVGNVAFADGHVGAVPE